ncbi:cysteine-rich receptor-like protein kinase [Tanacetum coccineum]
MRSTDAIWVLFGDFNVVRSCDERFGSTFVEKDARIFNDFIALGGLHDFALGGRRFTKFNRVGSLANGCNASFIVMVPKKDDPLEIGDYRLISLIGCAYKVLSKILVACLSHVIHKLIRKNQTAFISGRQILDGIMVANEIVNYAKKEGINLLLLKVDFEKAFDSINWIFLLGVMKQMSFGAKWCSWIYACLSSASVSILVNGSPTTEFKMEHGIRQGDTLSLFIFLIVSEALQVMVIEAHNKVGKDIRKSANLNGGIDRFSKKLSIWKVNLLSIGGRKWNTIMEERFHLGVKANKRKIMWIRWEHIIIDKKNGGLGIGSTKAKNMSLLGKWKWRFLSEPHVLWNKCIKEIHGYNGGFDSVELEKRDPRTYLYTLANLINELSLDAFVADKWIWSPDAAGLFTVKSLSNLIQNRLIGGVSIDVPFK